MYPRQYFDLFSPNINESLIFVGMSFDQQHLRIWDDIIGPAAIHAGFKPHRVDQGTLSDSILIEIMAGISTAKLLLFDITADKDGKRNGNVMYELGMAHAVRHADEVLIIRSDNQRLLFDIAAVRVHGYDVDDPDEARNELTRLITNRLQGIKALKTIATTKAISFLDEICLGFLDAHAGMEFFSVQQPERAFEPEVIEGRGAVRRLLELGILQLVWEREERKYAFTWTYFGQAVLNDLGMLEQTRDKKAVKQQFGYGDCSEGTT